jgi:hypothetical protein
LAWVGNPFGDFANGLASAGTGFGDFGDGLALTAKKLPNGGNRFGSSPNELPPAGNRAAMGNNKFQFTPRRDGKWSKMPALPRLENLCFIRGNLRLNSPA